MAVLWSWLNKLVDNADIQEYQPIDEIQEGEVVIHQISDLHLKKMFAARKQYQEEILTVKKELEEQRQRDIISGRVYEYTGEKHHPRTCPDCARRRKIETLRMRMNVLNELFWAAVRDEIGEEGDILQYENDTTVIGLRENWQIVAVPETPSDGPIIIGVGVGLMDLISSFD